MQQPIATLIKTLAGDLVWNIIIIIAITIPVWIITTELKDMWKDYQKRRRLVNDTLLSIDTYYKINGASGVLKEINKKWVKLQDKDEIHYIPINKVVGATITKKIAEQDKTRKGK